MAFNYWEFQNFYCPVAEQKEKKKDKHNQEKNTYEEEGEKGKGKPTSHCCD